MILTREEGYGVMDVWSGSFLDSRGIFCRAGTALLFRTVEQAMRYASIHFIIPSSNLYCRESVIKKITRENKVLDIGDGK